MVQGQEDSPLNFCAIIWDNYLLGKRRLCFWWRWFVCLSVCFFVCGQHYSKSYEWILMKFYGEILGGTMKNWLNFGSDLGLDE